MFRTTSSVCFMATVRNALAWQERGQTPSRMCLWLQRLRSLNWKKKTSWTETMEATEALTCLDSWSLVTRSKRPLYYTSGSPKTHTEGLYSFRDGLFHLYFSSSRIKWIFPSAVTWPGSLIGFGGWVCSGNPDLAMLDYFF